MTLLMGFHQDCRRTIVSPDCFSTTQNK